MKAPVVDTVGKTESFWSRNVRLITFLICMAIFLSVFGPLSVFHFARYFGEKEDTRVEMTLEDLQSLAKDPTLMTSEQLSYYKGERSVGHVGDITCEMYEIYIEERYLLFVGFNASDQTLFYWTLTDQVLHKELDLFKTPDKLGQFLRP